MDDVQRILQRAADNSSYVKRGNIVITPSRAGIPLLTQVLELLVLPKLPQPTNHGALSFNSKMSIAQGFIYESALYEELVKEYGEENVDYQEHVTYGEFQGTADFIVNTGEKLLVIDAKAVNVSTKRELIDRKIGTDNWSYRTQLALYVMAVADSLESDYPVEGMWYCWSPGAKKQWKVKISDGECIELANKANQRLETFKLIQQELSGANGDEVDFEAAVDLATSNMLELILPKDFYFGRPSPSTGFHFNPYAELFFYDIKADDEEEDDGFPIERDLIKIVTQKLMMDAYQGVDKPYDEYIAELNSEFS